MAFVATSVSPILPLSTFGIYAATAVVVNYLGAITFIPAAAAVNDLYCGCCRCACCRRCGAVDPAGAAIATAPYGGPAPDDAPARTDKDPDAEDVGHVVDVDEDGAPPKPAAGLAVARRPSAPEVEGVAAPLAARVFRDYVAALCIVGGVVPVAALCIVGGVVPVAALCIVGGVVP
eukprot:gene12494-29058_t